MSNCLYEASIQQISRECNCIPSFVAAYLSEGVASQPICEGPGKHCMSSIMDDIGAERFITFRNDSKECLAPCHDQTHQFLVTSSAYPNKQSFHLGDDFCLILGKLRISCANEKRLTLDLEYPTLCQAIDVSQSLSCDQIRGMNTSFHDLNETTLASLRKSVILYI